MNVTQKVIKPKLGLLELAKQLGSVSQACKVMDVNWHCERLNRTIKEEFYNVNFRKRIYQTIEEIQLDLDRWLQDYNNLRPHSGKYCYGKTPMQTFLETKGIAQEKNYGSINELSDSSTYLDKAA